MINKSAAEMANALASGELTSVALTKQHLERIADVDNKVKAFLHVDNENALAQAAAVDAERAAGKSLGPLAGVPLALKDVLAQEGVPTTAGSKILQGWKPPYDSTVVAKLKAAGVVILGKTNMDEFAMGSSTENSGYGPTFNPWDLTRTPGGSSGGSAAAVSAFEAPIAIGSDTGGSIRQPAALTGIVGVRPTYGAVSRYGLIAYSSSLDQAGPFGRTVLDTAMLHEIIAGHDPKDATSIDAPVPAVVAALHEQVDLFDAVLADVAAPQFAGLAIERDAPRIAQAERINLLSNAATGTHKRILTEWIIVRSGAIGDAVLSPRPVVSQRVDTENLPKPDGLVLGVAKPVSGQRVPPATVKWFDLKALGKSGEPLIIQPK